MAANKATTDKVTKMDLIILIIAVNVLIYIKQMRTFTAKIRIIRSIVVTLSVVALLAAMVWNVNHRSKTPLMHDLAHVVHIIYCLELYLLALNSKA